MKCTAHRQDGANCKAHTIRGGTVCRVHGGSAPQVKAAAARRILEGLVGPALVALKDIVTDPSIPENVRLAAARDILDRCGYRPPVQVEVLTIGIVEAEIMRLEAELGQ